MASNILNTQNAENSTTASEKNLTEESVSTKASLLTFMESLKQSLEEDGKTELSTEEIIPSSLPITNDTETKKVHFRDDYSLRNRPEKAQVEVLRKQPTKQPKKKSGPK